MSEELKKLNKRCQWLAQSSVVCLVAFVVLIYKAVTTTGDNPEYFLGAFGAICMAIYQFLDWCDVSAHRDNVASSEEEDDKKEK